VSGPLTLTATARRAFDRLAADLLRVFGPRLVAVVASGQASGVAFLQDIHAGDLNALGAIAEAWHRDGLDAPLLVTPDEFQRSLDTFPVEYQAIIDRHVLIAGRDPFGGARAHRDDLRRACEVQAKSHLIHLRQGWVNAHGRDAGLADLMVASAAPLRALLASVARLHGASAGDDVANAAARLVGIPSDLIDSILGLDRHPQGARALVPRLPEYLAASERLWIFVDGWRP
jgi:hypothetical protein